MRATNHSNTTIDLTTVFANGGGALTYAVTASNGGAGVSTANSALTIDYSALGAGTHTVTVTATDSDAQNAEAIIDLFVLEVIKLNDNSLASTVTLTGTTYADAITGNSFTETSGNLTNVDLDGGAGDDTISSNTLTANSYVYSITFDGGDGNDTISNNTLTPSNHLYSITFDGGAGNDTISGNTISAGNAGSVQVITFDGGDGNDTISNNHFEASGTHSAYDVRSVTLMGGAGDDLFSGNTATQANGESASLTIHGGDGEDTVVFHLNADQYISAVAWVYGETITISGDGAAVTLIDIETLSFADGTAYTTVDAKIEGNGGTTIDLASVFAEQVTNYTVSDGTVSNNSLTLAASELEDGVNTITITATDTNNNAVTIDFTIHADKSPTIVAAISDVRTTIDSNTTIDLTTVFANGSVPLTYAVTAPTGVSTANSALTIDYAALGVGTHTVTVTATDSDADSVTDEFVLEVIKLNDNSLASTVTLTGTTLDDAITGNSFAETSDSLRNVDLNGDAGNDTINNNTLTASNHLSSINIDGGAGNDTISSNTLSANDGQVSNINFDGGAGDDSINSNTLSATGDIRRVAFITFDGGDGNDSISNNTLTAGRVVYAIAFSGGAGDDTISDNHFETTGTSTTHDVYDITLMGGAGDDLFRDNTATQANGESASLTLDGGDGEDTVEFRLNADQYTGAAAWVPGETITITGDGAAVTLIDIETVSFSDGTSYTAADAKVEGNGSIAFDLASVFAEPVTSYTVSDGTVGSDNSLTLAGSELEDGVNTITVTATDANGVAVTMDIAIIADKSPTVDTPVSIDVDGNGMYTTPIILSEVFGGGSGNLTYTVSAGTIISSTILDVSAVALSEGDNLITVTASDSDADKATTTITINADKSPTIVASISDEVRTPNHSNTTIDLTTVFGGGSGTLTYAVTASNGGAGVSTANSALVIDYSTLGVGTHTVTVIATDSDAQNADSVTNEFVLRVITLNGNLLGSNATLTGTALADAITGNSFSAATLSDVDLDGGAGNDSISSNTFTTSQDAFRITFDGGAGNDTINSNTLTASFWLSYITFAGGDDNDTISSNTLTADYDVFRIIFDGGDGNDTISNNTLTGDDDAYASTLKGGAGDDTISDNHFESSGTGYGGVVYDIALMGGAGDDVFRDNTAIQANGQSASMTIDGGDGEDTVVFRLNADQYTGAAAWVHGETITISGDGAAVTLIDIETVTFLDGTTYIADKSPTIVASISDDMGTTNDSNTTIDLTTVFGGGNGILTYAVTASAGVSTANSALTIDYATLGVGTHTVTVTATDSDADAITDIFVVTKITSVDISGADSSSISILPANFEYVDFTSQTISENESAHGSNYTFKLDQIDVTGSSWDDYISDNVFRISLELHGINKMNNVSLYVESITFSLGGGEDAIDDNIFTTKKTFYGINLTNNIDYTLTSLLFDGGEGDDSIQRNDLTADGVYSITFDGGEGDDTISNNTLTSTSQSVHNITFDGGDGNDTISNNNLNAGDRVFSITFAGDAGNDTISDNHFESTGMSTTQDVYDVTLLGGAGDDLFSGNTATQNNTELSSITINGGADTDDLDTDKVYFELASTMFSVTGAYGSDITVTDSAKRTNAGDNSDVNSYAEYVLIDIEELYFDDVKYEF